MILKAKHNFFLYNFFQFYGWLAIKKNFHDVNFIGNFDDKKLSIIVIANHISWWDGFWIMYFNRKILKRKFYFMMLEEQLKKYRFFNYCGGFSISKNKKSIIESLKYCIELLNQPENMILIFPQGKIQSMHLQNFSFQKGIQYILQNSSKNFQVLFLANIVDYFSNSKPTLNVYYKEYIAKSPEIKDLQDGYNKFYLNSLDLQINHMNL